MWKNHLKENLYDLSKFEVWCDTILSIETELIKECVLKVSKPIGGSFAPSCPFLSLLLVAHLLPFQIEPKSSDRHQSWPNIALSVCPPEETEPIETVTIET